MPKKTDTSLPSSCSLFFSSKSSPQPNPIPTGLEPGPPPHGRDQSRRQASAPQGFDDTTFREIVHISLGGPSVRISPHQRNRSGPAHHRRSNIPSAGQRRNQPHPSGTSPSAAVPQSSFPLVHSVVSDPADLKVLASSDVAVSLFLPDQPIHQITLHSFADSDQLPRARQRHHRQLLDTPKDHLQLAFLKGLDVTSADKAAAIVTFGDSITDELAAAANTQRPLARHSRPSPPGRQEARQLGVLDEGSAASHPP